MLPRRACGFRRIARVGAAFSARRAGTPRDRLTRGFRLAAAAVAQRSRRDGFGCADRVKPRGRCHWRGNGSNRKRFLLSALRRSLLRPAPNALYGRDGSCHWSAVRWNVLPGREQCARNAVRGRLRGSGWAYGCGSGRADGSNSNAAWELPAWARLPQFVER